MTHFIGAVAVDTTGKSLDAALEEALAKFDENVPVPRYVSETKESLIKGERQKHSYAADRLAEYNKDPENYRGKTNTNHIEYITVTVPRLSALTDEELWDEVIFPNNESELDDKNQTRSTYNPDSKWDWYVIGGRWASDYESRQGESPDALATEVREALDKASQGINMRHALTDEDLLFASVDKDRLLPWWFPKSLVLKNSEGDWVWEEHGSVGWWGSVSEKMTEAEWCEKLAGLLEGSSATAIYYVDFHI